MYSDGFISALLKESGKHKFHLIEAEWGKIVHPHTIISTQFGECMNSSVPM